MNKSDLGRGAVLHGGTRARKHSVSRYLGRTRGGRRVLILGTGRLSRELCQSLIGKRVNGYTVIGFLDRDGSRVGEHLVNPSIIGTYEQLYEIVESRHVNQIAVCLDDRRGDLPVQTLLDLKAMGLEVLDGHELYERESGRLPIDQLKPSDLIFKAGFRRYRTVMALKRGIDIALATISVILLAPLFVGIAVLIKLDTPGPVFYRQIRVGYHGRPYILWKFRSMHENAETYGAQWAAVDDPRVTRVGRWLRKWRIDEFPQLFNVLKGEMSLIGPRPERPAFVQELRRTIPYYDVRHTIRPGISGWAQTQFRYGASTEDAHAKLQYDLFYVKNLSLGLDLRILVETVWVVLSGAGAR